MKKRTIAVIGGGASGLVAAITAAQCGAMVTIYERSERVGRKLLATGNGRCNLSNRQASVDFYHGHQPDFVQPALVQYSVTETLSFFEQLGIMTVEGEDGKLYPRSLQAGTVLDALRLACDHLGVVTRCGCEITAITPAKRGFMLKSTAGQWQAERVIVACGGAAAADLGGTDSGYRLLQRLGHHCSAIYPAIVQLKTDTLVTKALNGIKTNALVSLYQGDQVIRQIYGEVLFADYGLSGPPILSLSSLAVRLLGQALYISLDLFPETTFAELYQLLQNRRNLLGWLTLEDFISGMINKRLGQTAIKSAGLTPLSRRVGSLTNDELTRLTAILKDCRFAIKDTKGLKQAQVTAGGILTKDFDSRSLASKIVDGLYACGEVLDIDGECGGYNLQWAWSSGRLAGQCATLDKAE